MDLICREVIEKLGITDLQCKKAIRGCRGFTLFELIEGILKTDSLEELAIGWGYSSNVPLRNALREHLMPYFPNRSIEYGTGNKKGKRASWRIELLSYIGKKLCKKCNVIKDISNFGFNAANNSEGIVGIRAECKQCHTLDTKYQKYNISQRTPKWADKLQIRKIYSECPEGMHVDHIIPLRGELVSGLHVENNLQYLSPIDNMSKSNIYLVE